MPTVAPDLAIATDAVARTLAHAFEQAGAWGLRHFELREGERGRFPVLTPAELRALDDVVAAGSRIVAAAPGLFEGFVEDRGHVRHELEELLPRALDTAGLVGCRRLLVSGFAHYADEPETDRLLVLRAFERAAERADADGFVLALVNTPGGWADRPQEIAALVRELDHPALRVDWDPAATLAGGHRPDDDDVEALAPLLVGVHVRDASPGAEGPGWKVVGQGRVPWPELLHAFGEAGAAPLLTLAPTGEPLVECSEKSLDALRALVAA